MRLPVLYVGTPVVLVSSVNPDGSTNLAPMSSAWWLGQEGVIGMSAASQTVRNLGRDPRCVLNLVPSSLAAAVDRLALTTGRTGVPTAKTLMGYQYVADKFAHADLTRQPSRFGGPDRVAECPLQLEGDVVATWPLAGDDIDGVISQVRVRLAHVEGSLLVPGTHYVDPLAWDPLVMKFCDYFGGGRPVRASRLATGWSMPGRVSETGAD